MFRSECPICEHVNPADARFCNACGAPLYLVPCPRCGAMNDLIATDCYKCGARVKGRWADALAARSAAAAGKGGSGSVPNDAARGREPIAHPPSGTEIPHGLAAAEPNPQETLRELRRLMTTPVGGQSPATPDKAGPGVRVGSAAPIAAGRAPNVAAAGPTSAVVAVRAVPPGARTVSPRRRPGAIVGAGILAVLAALGYFALRQQPAADATQAPAANVETKGRVGPTGSGAIVVLEETARPAPVAPTPVPISTLPPPSTRPVPTAPERSVAATGETGASAGDAKRARSGTNEMSRVEGTGPMALPPSAAVTRGIIENKPSARRVTERAPEAAAAEAVLVPRPQPASAGERIEPAAPRLGPCTEALAALGLCMPESIQRRE